MKRWCDLTVTTALAALLLSGCGSAQNAVTSTQAPTQAQPASATDVAVVETENPQPEETPEEAEETPALPEHEAGDETRVDPNTGWTYETFYVTERDEPFAYITESYVKVMAYDENGIWRSSTLEYNYVVYTELPDYDGDGLLQAVNRYYNDHLVQTDEYDENGLKQRTLHYERGEVFYYTLYFYSAEGHLTKAESYYYDHLQEIKEYDENGRMVRVENYDYEGSGAFISYQLYSYDGQGMPVHSEAYRPDGSLLNAEEYEFYSNGEIQRITTIFGDDDQSEKNVTDYFEDGTRRSTYYVKDGSVTEIEYDQNGTRRKLTYYNPDGSVYGAYEFDENGDPIP